MVRASRASRRKDQVRWVSADFPPDLSDDEMHEWLLRQMVIENEPIRAWSMLTRERRALLDELDVRW